MLSGNYTTFSESLHCTAYYVTLSRATALYTGRKKEIREDEGLIGEM